MYSLIEINNKIIQCKKTTNKADKILICYNIITENIINNYKKQDIESINNKIKKIQEMKKAMNYLELFLT